MNRFGTKEAFLGVVAALGLAFFANSLLGQSGTAQPVRSETQYYVTGEGDDAHLWVREGSKLRCVGHGECTAHGDHGDHKHGDGHDHGKEKAKP